MGTVVVDLSVSLDGFIAGPDDGPAFLLRAAVPNEPPICDAVFTRSCRLRAQR